MGYDGVFPKYGPIKGQEDAVVIPRVMGASEVISAQSGRFVKEDASGRLEIAVDGTTLLQGWIEAGAQTCSSTEGATKVGLIPAAGCPCVFRIPVNAGTYVVAMLGKVTDISVTAGGIQGAKLDASGEDNLIIVGGDADNNLWVDVMINPAKLGTSGV